ncbi:PH domain-containing protein [Sphingobacterium pedocola]|uniref:YokE-like PH domain-containing protein n=1 Tax=Sphingobacterium pedocola TaxID=2082722 RepID=A0ABR9T1M1_9SPHI|nr:PH domain-containing protein [Sphingobacterium pedocola]MBE8719234.1 hypothetical protein [Sphingobacterium pedocola]
MSIDKYIQDGQDPKVIEKIYTKIIDMLTHGESINYIALQKKPAVTLLPDSITISNKRIFLCEFTKLGLATNFEIFSWKDIKDIAFKEEIFGSKVTVIPFTGENLSIDYIPKIQARKLYQLIKDALESNKSGVEKSTPIAKASSPSPSYPATEPAQVRPRYTEPVKNEANVERSPIAAPTPKVITEQDNTTNNFGTPAQTAVPLSTSKPEEEDELTQKLKKLKTLYDKQLITQAEYETKKSEILSQL